MIYPDGNIYKNVLNNAGLTWIVLGVIVKISIKSFISVNSHIVLYSLRPSWKKTSLGSLEKSVANKVGMHTTEHAIFSSSSCKTQFYAPLMIFSGFITQMTLYRLKILSQLRRFRHICEMPSMTFNQEHEEPNRTGKSSFSQTSYLFLVHDIEKSLRNRFIRNYCIQHLTAEKVMMVNLAISIMRGQKSIAVEYTVH